MNILILADLVTFSGVGNYIRFLSTSFISQGNNVIIATAQDDLHIEGVKTYLLKPININPFNVFCNLIRIRGIIRKYSIDVVHANHRMSSFLMGVYNLFYSHIPVVWTSHTGVFPMNHLKRILGYYGDKSIAISSECRDFMIDILSISETKIEIVSNGVNEKNLIPLLKEEVLSIKDKWNILHGKLVIAIHGRISYEKGLDFLVDIFSSLSISELSNVVVVCSGVYKNNLYYEKIQKKIIENNLQDIFIFVGWCDAREILGISDLFLNVSRREGFLLAAIEAFFMEVPVIRTTEGGYLDMKDLCIGIPFGDKDLFLSSIKAFINNPLMFSDMVKKAKAKALEQFTLDTMVNKTYEVYLSAIKSVRDN